MPKSVSLKLKRNQSKHCLFQSKNSGIERHSWKHELLPWNHRNHRLNHRAPPYWDVETDAKLRFDIVDRKTRQLLWDHDIAVHDKYRQGRLPTVASREATINDTLVSVMHRVDEAISSDEFKKIIMNAPLTPIRGLPQVKQ
jgi:hypothetical protein